MVLVRPHCSRHDDGPLPPGASKGNILPHVPTLGAGQASREQWAKRRPNEALAQRPPVPAREALQTLDWQRVRGRQPWKRESDSSNMCVKALLRASMLCGRPVSQSCRLFLCRGCRLVQWLSGRRRGKALLFAAAALLTRLHRSVAPSHTSLCLTLQGIVLPHFHASTPRSPTLVSWFARVIPPSLATARLRKTITASITTI